MRYPIRNGLLVSPAELGFSVPTPEQLATRKVTTVHHGWFERHRYMSGRHRIIFRNLVTHVFPLLAEEHLQLHEDYDAPKQPHDSLMIDVVDEYLALNGVITCISEKHTRQTYNVQEKDWLNIKRNYRSGLSEIPQAFGYSTGRSGNDVARSVYEGLERT